jgi:hypothetical protein
LIALVGRADGEPKLTLTAEAFVPVEVVVVVSATANLETISLTTGATAVATA